MQASGTSVAAAASKKRESSNIQAPVAIDLCDTDDDCVDITNAVQKQQPSSAPRRRPQVFGGDEVVELSKDQFYDEITERREAARRQWARLIADDYVLAIESAFSDTEVESAIKVQEQTHKVWDLVYGRHHSWSVIYSHFLTAVALPHPDTLPVPVVHENLEHAERDPISAQASRNLVFMLAWRVFQRHGCPFSALVPVPRGPPKRRVAGVLPQSLAGLVQRAAAGASSSSSVVSSDSVRMDT